MKGNLSRLALCLIFAVALILRLVALGRYPAGFTADEAAQGYMAYSILKTGKDEWGVRLPLAPRSFGDFKPPLQTYLMIPSIAVFGLNEFAVRLPSAILGILGVLGVYLLASELFRMKIVRINPNNLSLLSSLLLAISPWHISLSRGAFEANLTTFFLPLGFYFFLRGISKPKYLALGSLFLGLNLFTYHSARFFTPLFFIFLVYWQRKVFFVKARDRIFYELVAISVFVLFLVLASFGLRGAGGTRILDIGIFSAGRSFFKIFLDNYFSYLSPQFFFTQGAGEATYGMIPGRGTLYLFELPFLVLAFVTLVKRWDKRFLPILVWMLLAPIPAALSLGVGYHANRAAIMMPAIQILSAYGGVVLWQNIRSGLKGKIIKIAILLYCYIAILLFLRDYFFVAPKINAPAMAYGWREAMDYVTSIEDKYPRIIVSRKFSEPQAFIAFYKQWGPEDFQRESQYWLRYEKEGSKFVDQLGEYSLGKYEFRNLDWGRDRNLKNVLFVGREDDFSGNEELTKRIIPYPDGKPAFLIVSR